MGELNRVLGEKRMDAVRAQGLRFMVEQACGGASAHAHGPLAGPVHDPRTCQHPCCGQYRLTDGKLVAHGRTPVLAVEAFERASL